VNDLTSQLRPAIRKVNIAVSCRGLRVGVDAGVWLHVFCQCCADEVVLHKKYGGVVERFLARAAYLQSIGIILVFVFDGAPCPAKFGTDAQRAGRRALAYAKVEQANGALTQPSSTDLRAAISVNWEMKSEVIDALRIC
jgi:exonuclease-1